jgi:hypothetical protein
MQISETRKLGAKSMPRGETKSEILLYVANKPDGVRTPEIKEHLRGKLRLKNKKNLLTHLSDLYKEKLLDKEQFKRGVADTFYLKGRFRTLNALFDYMKSLGKEKEFMETRYFTEYISTPDFRAKYFVQLLKDVIFSTIGQPQESFEYGIVDFFINTFQLGDSKEIKKILDSLADYDFSKVKDKRIEDLDATVVDCINRKNRKQCLTRLLAILKTNDVDELVDYYTKSKEKRSTKPLIERLPNIIIPANERSEILVMLRSSPSAVESLLKYPKDILEMFMRFSLMNLTGDQKKDTEFVEAIGAENYTKALDLLTDFEDVKNRSPFYKAVSSSFVTDYLSKNIVEHEEDKVAISKLIENTFIPKTEAGV